MASIWQEIHCTISGGGCGGFILIKLNAAINRRVTLICPKCSHKHRRCVVDGQIVERGRFVGDAKEELCPTIAAWSDTPRTKCMQKIVEEMDFFKERNGIIITEKDDFIKPPIDTAELILRESWTDRCLGRV